MTKVQMAAKLDLVLQHITIVSHSKRPQSDETQCFLVRPNLKHLHTLKIK